MFNIDPIIPHFAALLAAIHRQPMPLHPTRGLPPSALTRLARLIEPTAPAVRSLRRHPALATALWLLLSAGQLDIRDGWLTTAADLLERPVLPPDQQLAAFVTALQDDERSAAARAQLHLDALLTESAIALIHAQLTQRQATADPAVRPVLLSRRADHWRLANLRRQPLLATLPLHLCGEARAGVLYLTPVTLAAARPYLTRAAVQRHLASALQRPLTADEAADLTRWWQLADAVQLATYHLLTVDDPRHLVAIRQKRTLRRHLLRQLSPLHAIVDPAIERPLRRYLATHNIPLAPFPSANTPAPAHAADQWLALRVLQQLGQLLPLPTITLAHSLAAAGQPLDAATLATLEARSAALLADIERLIRGDDAFEPAAHPPDPAIRAALQAAIAAGHPITITYQGIADATPRARTITPLYLEQRATLHYCIAWCHSAEAERVFRLDRITLM